jgi:hypothetical protein
LEDWFEGTGRVGTVVGERRESLGKGLEIWGGGLSAGATTDSMNRGVTLLISCPFIVDILLISKKLESSRELWDLWGTGRG